MVDLEKAKSTIEHLMERLDHHRGLLSSMTREDINYLRGRLDLLEYLLTQRGGAKIEPFAKPELRYCSICNLPTIFIYQHLGKWFCPEHFPKEITFPIGMHGDEFKAYQERKK
jgi:hypothetical protein